MLSCVLWEVQEICSDHSIRLIPDAAGSAGRISELQEGFIPGLCAGTLWFDGTDYDFYEMKVKKLPVNRKYALHDFARRILAVRELSGALTRRLK